MMVLAETQWIDVLEKVLPLTAVLVAVGIVVGVPSIRRGIMESARAGQRAGEKAGCNLLARKGRKTMQKYICDLCGYVYDPEVGDPDSGVAAGTSFEDLPDDWVCPECGAGKEDFSPM